MTVRVAVLYIDHPKNPTRQERDEYARVEADMIRGKGGTVLTQRIRRDRDRWYIETEYETPALTCRAAVCRHEANPLTGYCFKHHPSIYEAEEE